MKNFVSLSFKNLNQTEIVIFATNVVLKMLADGQFFAFKSEVELLGVVTKAYTDALSAASNKDSVLVLLKNNKRKELDDQLTVVAGLVNGLAKGDKAIIRASGYDPMVEAKALTELNAPTGLTVKKVQDQSGKVRASWDESKGTTSYALVMRKKGTEEWIECAFPSARSVVIKDLELGANMEFKVRSFATRGFVSNWSVIVDVWVS